LNFLRYCAAEAHRLNNSRVVIDCIQEFMKCTTLLEGFQEEVPVKQTGSNFGESLSMADSYIFPLSMIFAEMEKGQVFSKMNVLNLVNSGDL
jgi:hypothetical protein